MHIEIDSQYRLGRSCRPQSLAVFKNTSYIKNEPMLFNCSPRGVHTAVGDSSAPITNAFLSLLGSEGDWLSEDVVIDSRAHMLMPSWYPCIPGWHHDDVARTRADGQPQYHRPLYRSEHVMMLVNAEVCPTEIATGKAIFEVPPEGEVIYEKWHDVVEKMCDDGKLQRSSVPDGQLVFFNDRTWHRGTAAVSNGWRFFIRASRYFDAKTGERIHRGNERTNERRMQCQVYMSAENAGW